MAIVGNARIAECAHEDGVERTKEVVATRWNRFSRRQEMIRAPRKAVQLASANGIEHFDGLIDHLRADSIASDDRDPQHTSILPFALHSDSMGTFIRTSTVALATLVLAATLIAQSERTKSASSSVASATSGDWPMYAHDLRGNKFSTLADITSGNVARLTQAWSVRLTPPAGRRGGGIQSSAGGSEEGVLEGRARGAGAAAARGGGPGPVVDPFAAGPAASNPEATPIAVNGVLYLPAAGNRVLAVDGDSGKEQWRYTLPAGGTTTARGVAYWPGAAGSGPRILLTAGARLVALDATTGEPASGFGRSGAIDIGVPWNGVPVIYKNLAILGATTGELPQGLPGDTRAFDVRTGKKVWEFHTVPLHDS